MDSLYIVMPAYNEEENIESVVKQWYPLLNNKGDASRLVVADAGSTDRTHMILKDLQKEYPKLMILPDTLKQHGPKLIALYRYAISQKADYIFQTDSDGQTDPAEFALFWENRHRYDAIIGCRRERGDGKARAIVEDTVCFLLWCYFGIKIPDANAPFRLMRTELVDRYIRRFKPDYDLPNIMLTTFFAYYGENIAFKRISFRARSRGQNSINMKKIFKSGWKALGDFARFRRDI